MRYAGTPAGAGTGLVGLSAAAAMVPILIVLCPSFAGETGAYQAEAIALASDILGSAVTAIFGAYTELVARDGNDTVTVPVVNAVTLLIFQYLL